MESTPTLSDPRHPKAGLGALLTPANCVLLLIDHQPFQFAGLRSHDTQTIINNVVGLAKSAKLFGVPTLLTTVLERQGGYLLKPLQDVFPEQKPIDRTFINTWEDPRVVDWVKQSGRMKIVMAALWTEICLAMPVIQALGEGYEADFSDLCVWLVFMRLFRPSLVKVLSIQEVRSLQSASNASD